MHCETCGVSTQGTFRCGRCHAVRASVWILGTAVLAWVASIALFVVVSKVMYADIVSMYDGLGSAPPVPARIYFVLSEWLFPVVALVVSTTPFILFGLSRGKPRRLLTWSRRYAVTAFLGLGWAVLGVAQWYLSISTIIDKLS